MKNSGSSKPSLLAAEQLSPGGIETQTPLIDELLNNACHEHFGDAADAVQISGVGETAARLVGIADGVGPNHALPGGNGNRDTRHAPSEPLGQLGP